MTNQTIAQRLQVIRGRIAEAAEAVGRSPSSVRLVAVSKTVDIEDVAEAVQAGQLVFGENRVQELERKAPRLPSSCEWHMIGHLQRNKVRAAVAHAAWIHSVDSPALIRRIGRIAAEQQKRPVLLLEVNVSGEDSKFGISPDACRELLEAGLSEEALEVRGLMTMAPWGCPEAEIRRTFSGLRMLRDKLQEETGRALPELSMGMSGDFEYAIAEGATLVRIGTAVFGPRTY
jgi:pyridoxal phosphate enzyme (YggS family)